MIFTVLFFCLITLILCIYAFPLGQYLSVIDFPDGERKLHDVPVPQVGGISIMIPVVLTIITLSFTTELTKLYFILAMVSFLMTALGFFDDRKNLPAVLRLLISIILSIVALWIVPDLGVNFLYFSKEIHSVIGGPFFMQSIISYIFTVLCLVGLQNAVNMADGHNGIVTGISLTWALLLIFYSPDHMTPLLIALSICICVVMVFNLLGKLFLGDAGTYGISMVIGLVTIYIYNMNFSNLTADKIILMFLIPVLDTIRLMGQRLIKRRSPLSSDTNHFHHILRELFRNNFSVLIYLLIVAAPSILSIFWAELTTVWLLIVLVFYVSIICFYYFFKDKFLSQQM